MKISIIIPCYNERNTFEELLRRVKAVPLQQEKEIIIVDDFSKDGTRDLLKEIEKRDREVKVVYHDRNYGKGCALRNGFKAATGNIVLIQDADLEYDPNDYLKLLKPILENKADVVYGSRFAGGESHRVLYYWHSLGNRFLTFLSNIFTNLNLTDMEVCYKIFRREILQQIELNEDQFGFEPEVTVKMSRLKCRIYEVGISYASRTYAEGKKINWKDGVRALYVILKYSLFK